MSKPKKPVEVEAPKELTPEEIAALEADRAQLAAMVAAGSFTKPDAAAGHVNPFVDDGQAPAPEPEPVSALVEPAPISVEPEPSMEPVQLAQLIQTRQQARDELRAMQDTLDGLSEAQQVVLADAVALLKSKVADKLAELQALDAQIGALQKSAPSVGAVAGLAASEAAEGRQQRATTQAERNRELEAQFKEPMKATEKALDKLRSFAKIVEKSLAEIASYTYQDFQHWDGRWQKAIIQGGTPGTLYGGGGAIQAAELLQHLRHQLHHVPALLHEVRDYLRAGARDSQDWRLECKDLLRSLGYVPDAEEDLENRIAGFSKVFALIVAEGRKSATSPGKTPLKFISPPPPASGPVFKQTPDVTTAQLHPKEN